MPNQRKENKRGISVYVPNEIKDALVQEAKRRGVPMSELITQFYRDELSRLGYDLNTTTSKNKKENK